MRYKRRMMKRGKRSYRKYKKMKGRRTMTIQRGGIRL